MHNQTTFKTEPQVGVGILVMKKEGNKEFILLHRRNKVSFGTGYWGSGGGHVDLGESLMSAALRELREEAGEDLKVKNVRFFAVCNFTELQPKHYVDVSFMADWVSGEPVEDDAGETMEWQWFDINELPSPLFPVVERYMDAYRRGSNFIDSEFQVLS